MAMRQIEEFLAAKFPSEWLDDNQASSLFSSFSQPRAVNPEAYDQRVRFWRDVILDSVRHGLVGSSVFGLPDSSTVTMCFQRKGTRPLGIGHVMKCMVSEGVATIDRGEDAVQESGEGPESLLVRLARLTIAQPLASGWRWIAGSHSPSYDEDDGSYSDVSRASTCGPLTLTILLREFVGALIECNAERLGSHAALDVMSYKGFMELIQATRQKANLAPITSSADIDLLLQYMKRNGTMAIIDDSFKREDWIIRLAAKGQGFKGKNPDRITREEADIVRLRVTHERLENQLESLATQVELHRMAAKEALSREDRPLALFELRRSKAMTEVRNQRLSASETISTILLRIDSAKSNGQVFEAYRLGEKTLRSIISKEGLDLENIDSIVVSLQEVLVEHESISNAISQGGSPGIYAGDEELNEELAMLLRGESATSQEGTREVLAEEEAERVLSMLPTVPLDDPIVQRGKDQDMLLLD